VEGRLKRTQRERNETNETLSALKLKTIHPDPFLREQGVGSSNLPAQTNLIKGLPLSLERWATFSATFSSLKRYPFIHSPKECGGRTHNFPLH